jgi:hypothetical protein
MFDVTPAEFAELRAMAKIQTLKRHFEELVKHTNEELLQARSELSQGREVSNIHISVQPKGDGAQYAAALKDRLAQELQRAGFDAKAHTTPESDDGPVHYSPERHYVVVRLAAPA